MLRWATPSKILSKSCIKKSTIQLNSKWMFQEWLWLSPNLFLIWVFPKIVGPQNGWFIMENPHFNGWFRGTPIFGNTHISAPKKLPCFQWIFRGWQGHDLKMFSVPNFQTSRRLFIPLRISPWLENMEKTWHTASYPNSTSPQLFIQKVERFNHSQSSWFETSSWCGTFKDLFMSYHESGIFILELIIHDAKSGSDYVRIFFIQMLLASSGRKPPLPEPSKSSILKCWACVGSLSADLQALNFPFSF